MPTTATPSRDAGSRGDAGPRGDAGAGDVAGRKRELRRVVRARRRDAGPAETRRSAAGIADVLGACPLLAGARRVACYASLPGEPGTGPLRERLRRRGVEVLLPVLLPDGDLDWVVDGAEGAGEAEPSGPDAVARADVVVVPALAVDTLGRRLGQGGGSYDRALERVPARVPVLAVVHDGELYDAAVAPLPVEAHDRGVGGVATPTRWLWLTP